jgi:hypothetical protein
MNPINLQSHFSFIFQIQSKQMDDYSLSKGDTTGAGSELKRVDEALLNDGSVLYGLGQGNHPTIVLNTCRS